MSEHAPVWRNPTPTVDVIIEQADGTILLIERRNEPRGWALPGGFVDEGESVEHAAVREALEETSLHVELIEQLLTYSDPARDPRKHTLSVVFIATAQGTPQAGDDAAGLRAFPLDQLPEPLCFDHGKILADYIRYKRTGERPRLGARP
jgi:8-oxo-dGTP diphosphatase